eukprot:1900432-Amphidinium_carterae.3
MYTRLVRSDWLARDDPCLSSSSFFFARVPSESNPADEASRDLVAEVALKFHARAVEVTACALSAWLGSVGVVACMTQEAVRPSYKMLASGN